jgi:hypothetical protein
LEFPIIHYLEWVHARIPTEHKSYCHLVFETTTIGKQAKSSSKHYFYWLTFTLSFCRLIRSFTMSSSQKEAGALRINPNAILVLQPTLITVLSDQGEAVVEKEIPLSRNNQDQVMVLKPWVENLVGWPWEGNNVGADDKAEHLVGLE